MAEHIEKEIIKQNYLSDAVVVDLAGEKTNPSSDILSTKTIYNYIDQGIFSPAHQPRFTAGRKNKKAFLSPSEKTTNRFGSEKD